MKPFRLAGIFALSLLLSVVVQFRSGAYRGDLSGDADEAAHAVTCLMVRDYVTQGFGTDPVGFEREFYAHYPKVGLGHWPPLFYCSEAVWMLVAGRNRCALLLFVALCGAAMMASVYAEVRRRAGMAAAVTSVAVLLCSATFRHLMFAVRPDLLLGLLVFTSTVCWVRFLDLGRRGDAIATAVLSVAAMLTHGRGAVLLLVLPMCALALRGKTMRRRWLMVSVAALLLPALLLWALPLTQLGDQERVFSGAHVWLQVRLFFSDTFWFVGGVSMALTAVGTVAAFRAEEEQGFWKAMVVLVGANLLFSLLVPIAFDDLWLVTALPAMAALAGNGVRAVLGGLRRPGSAHAVVVLAMVLVARSVWGMQRKSDPGFRGPVVAGLLRGSDVALIGADVRREGALIVESALADPKREHTVLRGTKVLSQSSWAGNKYRLVFRSPAEVVRFLDWERVSLVVVQTGDAVRPDVMQLRHAVAGNSEWTLLPTTVPRFAMYRRVAR